MSAYDELEAKYFRYNLRLEHVDRKMLEDNGYQIGTPRKPGGQLMPEWEEEKRFVGIYLIPRLEVV